MQQENHECAAHVTLIHLVGGQATNDADGYVLYVPSGPGGVLVGSDFTSFFLAAAANPQVNGMRLQKVWLQRFRLMLMCGAVAAEAILSHQKYENHSA